MGYRESSNRGNRRGPKPLPPIQASPSETSSSPRWRRAPFVPLARLAHEQPAQTNMPLPPGQPSLERRPSKMALFTLFSRPKVERAHGYRECEPPSIPYTRPPSQPAERPPTPPPKSSTSFLRTPDQASAANRTREPVAPSRGSVSRCTRKTAHWEAPPLFQAYPQAIKYAKLQASHMSAEGILREQKHRRQYSLLQEKLESKLDLHAMRHDSKGEEPVDMQSVRNGDKNSQVRLSISSESPPMGLPTKLYVLVTSGYVLQYAGEGPSDRLPEKVLQLGKDSAAFASDLIPGKHWVLQISQAAKEDGTAAACQARTLLSRLRFGNQSAKRAVSSLLLVMEGPEEMDSWLTAVRKQIELLGGMKCNSEPGSRPLSSESKEPELQGKPSHRYLVQRDPNRMDVRNAPAHSPAGTPSVVGSDWSGNTARFSAIISDPTSSDSRHTSVRQSTDAPSLSATVVSNEQVQLNSLRDSSRLSVMSSVTSGTGTGTVATSRTSSAPTSPTADAFTLPATEQMRRQSMLRPLYMNPTSSANRRRSMQPLTITGENNSTWIDPRPQNPQRHSTYGATGRNSKAQTESDPRQTASYPGRFPIAVNAPPRALLADVRSTSAPNSSYPRPSPPATPERTDCRPDSIVGSLPTSASLSSHTVHRPPSSPQLGTSGFRPPPVRISQPMISKRLSSLPPQLLDSSATSSSAPTLPSAGPTFFTLSQHSSTPSLPLNPQQQPAPALRRPTSMQIRSDPAPFLSSARPPPASHKPHNIPISSTQTPPPGPQLTRLHPHPVGNAFATAAAPSSSPPSPSATPSRSATPTAAPPSSHPKPKVKARQSIPAIRLPPQLPPPNMPLPTLPPPDVPLPAVPRPVAV